MWQQRDSGKQTKWLIDAFGIDTFEISIESTYRPFYKHKNAKFLCLWQTLKKRYQAKMELQLQLQRVRFVLVFPQWPAN